MNYSIDKNRLVGKLASRCFFAMMLIVFSSALVSGFLRGGTATPAKARANSADAQASAIVQQMTLDEKILELHGVGGPSPNARIVPAIPRLNIPAFVITNGPDGATNGTIKPSPPATAMPVTLSLAASWDTKLAYTYGTVLGTEAKTLGNDMLEGPDMNLARVPEGGRTFENLGEDPYLAGQIAVSDIQGIQSQGVIAEAKHFAGNEQEQGRNTNNSVIDERTLHELYLAPFEASVEQGHVGAVMCAYPQVNGQYSCENKVLLQDILRTAWNFNGFVTSDFGATHSTVPSALNGLDLEMRSGLYFSDALKAAVLAGTVPMSIIDAKLIRRFSAMIQMGLWNNPPVAQAIPTALTTADGIKARQVAEEGMVLLKNTGNLLPLNATTIHSIAVIGLARYAHYAKTGGIGSSEVTPLYTVDPRAGLQARVGPNVKITYSSGVNPAAAQATARAADVAIVMVGDNRKEGEDAPLALNYNQDAIVTAVAQANKNTIVVVKSGSAILMPWVGQVPAILETWYPGEEEGNALAAVLFGDVNPSGKLPLTFPQQVSDEATNTPAQYPGINGQVQYSEGLDIGYRHYDASNIQPLFPFGFGLSYTTYAYSHLHIVAQSGKQIQVDFDVTNTGTRVGDEVAQVYVGMPAAAGEPPQQLKGFQKIHLTPGATGHASITLNTRAFQQWSTTLHNWATTPGAYQILVGSSSRDILLHGSVTE